MVKIIKFFEFSFIYLKYHFFEVKILSGRKLDYYYFILLNLIAKIFNKKWHYQFSTDLIIKNKIGKFFLKRNADFGISAIPYCYFNLLPVLKLANSFSIAIDIGANIGLTSMILYKKNSNLEHIYAIEAAPDTCNILEKNININQFNKKIHLINLAISDKNGEKIFFANTRNSMLSFIGDNISDMQKMHTKNNIFGRGVYQTDDFKKIKVNSATLDEFIRKKKITIEEIGIIKVDIEGGELKLIEGGLKTFPKMKKASKVIIEISNFSLHKEKILNFFKEHGFQQSKLTDVDYCFTKI